MRNISQGQILAVWILAAKLPHSELDFAVDFGVDFHPALCVTFAIFERKKAYLITLFMSKDVMSAATLNLSTGFSSLRLRVQSLSRTRLRIVASITYLFRACFKDLLRAYSTTIARLSLLRWFRARVENSYLRMDAR